MRAATSSSRRRPTSADSSNVRPGASPRQNGMVGGAPWASRDDDLAAADVLDPPRRVAQQEDVAGVALDGEVFVERADDRAVLVVGDDAVVGDLGNGAAAGDGRQPGALAGPQPAVDAVAVQVGAMPAALRRDAFAEHLQHRVVIVARQVAIRIRPAAQLEERVLVPVVAGDGGDDLLGQDVQRRTRDLDAVEPALADRADQGQAFEQLVAAQREQPALRHQAQRVPGPADALQERGDRARRAELADQVDVADVDAQLQRRRGHDRLQAALLEPLLRSAAGCGATGCRDATAPGPRRAAPSADGRRARPACAC